MYICTYIYAYVCKYGKGVLSVCVNIMFYLELTSISNWPHRIHPLVSNFRLKTYSALNFNLKFSGSTSEKNSLAVFLFLKVIL